MAAVHGTPCCGTSGSPHSAPKPPSSRMTPGAARHLAEAKSARRSQVGPRPASGNRTPGRPADCAPSGRLQTPRDRCRDLPGSAARRTWRISSSSEGISANDGHAAITRPIRLDSATAILAARLATLLATRSAHGNAPPLRPDRESGQERGRRSDDHPVHRQRRQGGNPSWLLVQLHQPRCI